MTELITAKQLAERLKLSVSTIYYWTSSRQIPFVKFDNVVRFDIETIERWLQDKAVEPKIIK
jgi:excisionase family DNA binding protein